MCVAAYYYYWLMFVFCSDDYQLVGMTSSERSEELSCESGMYIRMLDIWILLTMFGQLTAALFSGYVIVKCQPRSVFRI